MRPGALGALFFSMVLIAAVVVSVLAFLAGCFNGLSIIGLLLWGLVARILWVQGKEQA